MDQSDPNGKIHAGICMHDNQHVRLRASLFKDKGIISSWLLEIILKEVHRIFLTVFYFSPDNPDVS